MAENTKKTEEKTDEKQLSFDEKYAWIKPGIVVKIYQKIKEINPKGEEKERVQMFEGTVIARKHGKGIDSMITVRKVSDGVGVEKILPLHLPSITKIEAVRKFKTRKSKLYYLRDYKKKLKEDKNFQKTT